MPSATSNLAGYDDYVVNNIPNYKELGIYIIDRTDENFKRAKEELATILFGSVQKKQLLRIALR